MLPQVLIVNEFSPGVHTYRPKSSISIYGGLIIKWSGMCNRCPHIALNININLGHICMLVLFDYVEWEDLMIRGNFTVLTSK